jgi:hypothetical protein
MRLDGDIVATRPNPGARVGYTRVSTVSQTLDQQNVALEAARVTKTFSDTMSGARDDRPGRHLGVHDRQHRLARRKPWRAGLGRCPIPEHDAYT